MLVSGYSAHAAIFEPPRRIIILKSQSPLSHFLLNPHITYEMCGLGRASCGEDDEVADKKDQLVRGEDKAPTARQEAGDVAAFLAKAKLVRTANEKKGHSAQFGRLIFALDATMSVSNLGYCLLAAR